MRIVEALAIFIDPDLNWVRVMNLARHRGYTVVNIASSAYSSAYPELADLADDTFACDTSDYVDIMRVIRPVLDSSKKTALLTSNDATLEAVAHAAAALGIPFTAPSAVGLARNKARMRQILADNGMIMPCYALFSHIDEMKAAVNSVGYPCIVKPVSGHQSWFCFRINSENDIQCVYKDLEYMIANLYAGNAWSLKNGFICEAWLDGPVISVAMAGSNNEIIPVCVSLGTFAPEAPCSGFGSVVPYIENLSVSHSCIAYAKRVCSLMGLLVGLFDLEMVWTNRGPVILEVNARRMGGVMPHAFTLATGVDFSGIILDAYFLNPLPSMVFTSGNTAIIRKIIAGEHGRLQSFPSDEWFQRFGDDIVLRGYDKENTDVDKFDVIARVIAVDTSAAQGFNRLDALVLELEKITGMSFLRGELPNFR